MIKAPLISTRDSFGDALLELGSINESIVVIDADNSRATRTDKFSMRYPERFINVGVAEQNLIGVAAGLALSGKVPIVSTHAIFLCGRAFEQIRNVIAYGNLNVKLVGTHSGISVGKDGPTHFAIEDIALMRVLPNMTVVVPADALQTQKALYSIVNDKNGPVYLRLSREPGMNVTNNLDNFTIGKGSVISNGYDVLIITCGLMLGKTVIAEQILKKKGIYSTIINLHTIKPFDIDLIVNAAIKCGAVVTVEEHNVMGGLGSAVAEVLSRIYPVPIEMVGINDCFTESGEPGELFDYYGLNTEHIVDATEKVLNRKKSESNR